MTDMIPPVFTDILEGDLGGNLENYFIDSLYQLAAAWQCNANMCRRNIEIS